LDRNQSVWIYRPDRHKTAHRGYERVICIGPRCQLILAKYLQADPDALLFSPAKQAQARKAERRGRRRSPAQPSQAARAKKSAKRRPGEQYCHHAINTAIRRACTKLGLERWHVHRIRHTASLVILREHGAEAARSTLGHKSIDMTLHYSGIDLERAKEVA